MGETIRPCPFCGGEAKLETYGGTACAVVCQSCHCGTPTMSLADVMAAVSRWNLRAERTCRNVSHEPLDFRCSECWAETYLLESGATTMWCEGMAVEWSYCPSCGARVVEEKA